MKTLGLIVFVLALLCFIVAAPSACTQPDEARRVLAVHGYTQVEITGWRPLMGSESDVFSTGFRAKAPNGFVVTGAVTSGAFKGFTVRLD